MFPSLHPDYELIRRPEVVQRNLCTFYMTRVATARETQFLINCR